MLTTYAEDSWVFRALRAGARGYLTRDAGAEDIHAAITAVAGGQAQLAELASAGGAGPWPLLDLRSRSGVHLP